MTARHRLGWDAGLFAAALGLAYALKSVFSSATASELEFLLAPTARGVELLTGHDFPKETGAGYVNLELGVAIAPACSGMNFLIIAFATLVFGFVPRCEGPRRKLAWFVTSALLAFAVTVVVNTLRITLSLAERALEPSSALSPHAAHRVVGVGVYLVCLIALYAAVQCAFRRAEQRFGYAVPLACYLTVTLLVPLLRGAHTRADYAEHAGVVLLGASAAALFLRGASALARRATRDGASCLSRRAGGSTPRQASAS